ncbi:2OG-Fe(II) oxygenase [uncultured Gilvimarinus sp.]|uniref:2OG-Fe(II) oxygenase n=1 Tax=uncultured Gilvimarinus sp. TaxID=1689143 RepID=UPI0030DC5B3B
MSEPVKAPDILSETTRSATESLADQFSHAKPFRHLVIDNFFTPEFCQSLLDKFPGFDDKHARDENGNIGRKATYDRVRSLGAPYVTLDDTVKSPDFLAWVSQITGIPELLYDPNYFGGGTHENRHGQDLDPHVDFNKHPTSGHYRRLNLIVYLNHEWQDDWGGAIEFHKNPRLEPEQNNITKVTPLFNRCVIFETTFWSWHGFERINLPEGDSDSRSRKSVALYFYSAERPKEEMVKPHSTIYVERPLPEHIQPGHTLSDDDYQRIKVLLTRRDQHLERLYNNISSLTAHAEGLEHRLNSQTGATGDPRWKRFARRIKAKLID